MAKNNKNNIKNAINKQRKYDMDLLHVAGFDDVASALAAIDSQSVELREIEKDYDALINKNLELEDELAQAHSVIVSQAIRIHSLLIQIRSLAENDNAQARD
jgi:hypothetical protein